MKVDNPNSNSPPYSTRHSYGSLSHVSTRFTCRLDAGQVAVVVGRIGQSGIVAMHVAGINAWARMRSDKRPRLPAANPNGKCPPAGTAHALRGRTPVADSCGRY